MSSAEWIMAPLVSPILVMFMLANMLKKELLFPELKEFYSTLILMQQFTNVLCYFSFMEICAFSAKCERTYSLWGAHHLGKWRRRKDKCVGRWKREHVHMEYKIMEKNEIKVGKNNKKCIKCLLKSGADKIWIIASVLVWEFCWHSITQHTWKGKKSWSIWVLETKLPCVGGSVSLEGCLIYVLKMTAWNILPSRQSG